MAFSDGGKRRLCVHCARVDVVHSIKSNRFAINNIILNAINEECETCVLERIHPVLFLSRNNNRTRSLAPLSTATAVRQPLCASVRPWRISTHIPAAVGKSVFYFHFLSNFEQSHSPHLVAWCVFAFATPSSCRLFVVSHENCPTNGTVFRSVKYEILSNFSQ